MSGTDLIFRMSHAAIAAKRPVDHARRMSMALLLGFLVGAVVSLFVFTNQIPLARMPYVLIPIAVLAILVYLCWYLWQPAKTSALPVVARVLGTTEARELREVRHGILVPVVVKPLDDRPSFTTMITIPVTSKDDVDVEPPVGTLLPLYQVDPELGELAEGEVTEEQRELMEQLVKRPRLLSNKAPILPIRRGALERAPLWVSIQWWVTSVVGVFLALMFVETLNRF